MIGTCCVGDFSMGLTSLRGTGGGFSGVSVISFLRSGICLSTGDVSFELTITSAFFALLGESGSRSRDITAVGGGVVAGIDFIDKAFAEAGNGFLAIGDRGAELAPLLVGEVSKLGLWLSLLVAVPGASCKSKSEGVSR